MREVLKSMREVLKSMREFLKSMREVFKVNARGFKVNARSQAHRSKSVSQGIGESLAYPRRTYGVPLACPWRTYIVGNGSINFCNSFVLSGTNFIFAQREQIPCI